MLFRHTTVVFPSCFAKNPGNEKFLLALFSFNISPCTTCLLRRRTTVTWLRAFTVLLRDSGKKLNVGDAENLRASCYELNTLDDIIDCPSNSLTIPYSPAPYCNEWRLLAWGGRILAVRLYKSLLFCTPWAKMAAAYSLWHPSAGLTLQYALQKIDLFPGQHTSLPSTNYSH